MSQHSVHLKPCQSYTSEFAKYRRIKVNIFLRLTLQARVQGGGPKGPAPPPPPLEIENQKQKQKKSSEQILSYFTYILLLF